MSDAHMDAKVLRRAGEIVLEGWCQHALAMAEDAAVVLDSALDPRAVRWCAIGAVHLAAVQIMGDEGIAWRPASRLRTDVGGSIAGWNNAPGRTAEEVADVLFQAAARCDGVSPEPSLTARPA